MKTDSYPWPLATLLVSATFCLACTGPTLSDPGNGALPGPVEVLTISPRGGTFVGSKTVALSTSVAGAKILYTTDGTTPGVNGGHGNEYKQPIAVNTTGWLRAVVTKDDKPVGPVQNEVYVRLAAELTDFSSNLPLVVIDSLGHDIDAEAHGVPGADGVMSRPYRPIKAVFIDATTEGRAGILGQANWAGRGGLHVRGSSSAEYEKKQYKLETWDEHDQDIDVSLLGLPPESDWILHAPYSDKTLMRNHLIYSWSRKIGRYAPRSKFVELFMVADGGSVTMDDYRGVYLLMESIKRDRSRVNVEKLTPEMSSQAQLGGGYILAKDRPKESEHYQTHFTTAVYEDSISYVYPKPRNITAAQRAWIKDYLDDFETVLASPNFTDPTSGYRAYIDVQSFIDFMMLVEIGRNVDGYVLSTYLFKPRNGLLQMGPIWDFNGALGNADYHCSWLTQGWHYEFVDSECSDGPESFPPVDNPKAFEWYYRLMQDPGFLQARASRWQQLRASELSTAKVIQDIDAAAAYLHEAQQRNFKRWPILGQHIWPNDLAAEDRTSFAEEIDYFKSWLTGRLQWLDAAVQ